MTISPHILGGATDVLTAVKGVFLSSVSGGQSGERALVPELLLPFILK